jgi:hypothetical protein
VTIDDQNMVLSRWSCRSASTAAIRISTSSGVTYSRSADRRCRRGVTARKMVLGPINLRPGFFKEIFFSGRRLQEQEAIGRRAVHKWAPCSASRMKCVTEVCAHRAIQRHRIACQFTPRWGRSCFSSGREAKVAEGHNCGHGACEDPWLPFPQWRMVSQCVPRRLTIVRETTRGNTGSIATEYRLSRPCSVTRARGAHNLQTVADRLAKP